MDKTQDNKANGSNGEITPDMPEIIDLFYKNKDPKQSSGMAAYMENNFEFLGLKRPVRNSLQKEFIKGAKKAKAVNWDFVFYCWNLPEREFQYLAVDYLTALKNLMQKEDMEKLEKLITSKSWWDTVDSCASVLVGEICMRYPELIKSHILKWAAHENIWLVRTAILFQLKYKDKTDHELLGKIISQNNESKEFFINKAIGWALREYSKTNPEWVRKFIGDTTLHPLSIREGSKYL